MSDIATILTAGAGLTVLKTAGAAAGGAFSGSVGAAILRDTGRDGYSPLSGAQSGAVGGAVLAIPVTAVSAAILRPFSTRDAQGQTKNPWILEMGLNVAASAAYTVTGAAILKSAGHPNVMDVYHAGRAGLVGSATMLAAGVALSVVIGAGLLAFGCSDLFVRRWQHDEVA